MTSHIGFRHRVIRALRGRSGVCCLLLASCAVLPVTAQENGPGTYRQKTRTFHTAEEFARLTAGRVEIVRRVDPAVEAALHKAYALARNELNDNEFTGQSTAQGLDRYRAEFEGEFNGNSVKGVTVVDGDKGWRKFGAR